MKRKGICDYEYMLCYLRHTFEVPTVNTKAYLKFTVEKVKKLI